MWESVNNTYTYSAKPQKTTVAMIQGTFNIQPNVVNQLPYLKNNLERILSKLGERFHKEIKKWRSEIGIKKKTTSGQSSVF